MSVQPGAVGGELLVSNQASAGRKRASLKNHEEQIGHWAAEGKDDEWIARAVGSSASSVQSFRSRHGIAHYKRRSEPPEAGEAQPGSSYIYEAVLERRLGEDGREHWAVYFDPAIADCQAYRCWKQTRVAVSYTHLTLPTNREV